jgi:hypothetical protein
MLPSSLSKQTETTRGRTANDNQLANSDPKMTF